jgi:hypothetical protein
MRAEALRQIRGDVRLAEELERELLALATIRRSCMSARRDARRR